jgi:hypothetical protein
MDIQKLGAAGVARTPQSRGFLPRDGAVGIELFGLAAILKMPGVRAVAPASAISR